VNCSGHFLQFDYINPAFPHYDRPGFCLPAALPIRANSRQENQQHLYFADFFFVNCKKYKVQYNQFTQIK